MKDLIYKFFFTIGRLMSILYPQKISILVKRILIYIYTGRKSYFFKYIGNRTIIKFSLTLVGGKYISIGNDSTIGERGVLTAWDLYRGIEYTPQIIIGNNCNIGDDCHISAINFIHIGDNVLMGKKITITDNSHGQSTNESINIPPLSRPLYSKGPIIIKDSVWIGDKTTILPGITIGKNAIIGANSVVNKDIPENTVYAGNPARFIKSIDL